MVHIKSEMPDVSSQACIDEEVERCFMGPISSYSKILVPIIILSLSSAIRAELLYRWDFTSGSTVDSVNGVEAVLSNPAGLSSSGYTFTNVGEGITVDQPPELAVSDKYAIELDFSLDRADQGYQRLIDFADFANDEGMYAYDDYFYFYDESPDDDTYTFAGGESVTLRISRNGSCAVVTASLNGNVLWSFNDSSDYAVFNATNNRMRFFEDDGSEHPAGTVTGIRVYSVADGFEEQASGSSVLILDDAFGCEVADFLESQGHEVTSVYYPDWDGTNPSPSTYDLVLLLNGEVYDYELGDNSSSEAYSTLNSYVESGGTFLLTEWTAYDMANGVKLGLEPLVPFVTESYVGYDYSGTYTKIGASPLVQGIPESFDAVVDADGGVCIGLKDGAEPLMARQFDYAEPPPCPDENPGLVLHRIGEGTVIWINSDLGHEDNLPATEPLLQIVANAVGFDLRSAADQATPVPLMPAFLFLLLTGLVGVVGARRMSV